MTRNAQDCIVRPAVHGDLLGLLQLHSRSDERLGVAVHAPSDTEGATWVQMLKTENLTTYVADIDGEVAGAAQFLTMPNLGYKCRPSGFIEAMVVAASHRRRGIARQIIGRILADASSFGCYKIQLLTHKRHAGDGAHDFYQSVGFRAEAEGFRLYLGDDQRNQDLRPRADTAP